jgi:hypothetical protein
LVAALLLGALVGCVLFSIALARDDAAPKPRRDDRQSVPLKLEARATAAGFIRTAVIRKNLRRAWRISGPGVRQCLTLGQWMTANIPVLPYPADVSRSRIRIESSHPTEASLEVTLKPKPGSIDTPQVFYLGLTKGGTGAPSRWVVDSWTAAAPASPPSGRC